MIKGEGVEIKEIIENVEDVLSAFNEVIHVIDEVQSNIYDQNASVKLDEAKASVINALQHELDSLFSEKGWKIEEEDLCDYCIAHLVKDKYKVHVWWDEGGLGVTLEKSGEVLDSYRV